MIQFNAVNNAVETEEGSSNPYNAKKEWNESTQNVERGLQGANDSIAYATPKKTPTVISTSEGVQPLESQEGTTQATQTGETTTEVTQGDEPYSKVDYKKRYDDLKKHYDNKLNQFKAEKEALEATAKANQPKFVAPKTPEELATFKEQYPDVFDVIETVAHSRAEEQLESLSEKVSHLAKREEELAAKEAEQKLLELQPDFLTIREDKAFHEWAKEQPNEIQGWIYNNNGDAYLASRAIALYKTDQGVRTIESKKEGEVSTNKTVTDPRGSAADAVSVATATSGQPVDNAAKVWTQAEIASMSISEYERLAPELDKAFKEGRVVA